MTVLSWGRGSTKLFSPKNGEARIRFRLRREEDIQLDVIDDQGTVVRHALGTGVFGQASTGSRGTDGTTRAGSSPTGSTTCSWS